MERNGGWEIRWKEDSVDNSVERLLEYYSLNSRRVQIELKKLKRKLDEEEGGQVSYQCKKIKTQPIKGRTLL